MTIAIDTGDVAGTFTTSTSPSVAGFQTSGKNRLACVVVTNEASVQRTCTAITVSGLTFTKRKGFQYTKSGGTVFCSIDYFTAPAQAQLSSNTVTATMDGSATKGEIVAWSVKGLSNVFNPFDENVSLPATNKDVTGSNTAPTATVSTSNPITMIMAMAFSNAALTNPTGFATIHSIANGLLVSDNVDKTFTSKQSSLAVTFGTNTSNWGIIVDALKYVPTIVPVMPMGGM